MPRGIGWGGDFPLDIPRKTLKLNPMNRRVWTLTIDDSTRTFLTLEAATGFLGKAFDGTQKIVSLESQLLNAEGRPLSEREDVG